MRSEQEVRENLEWLKSQCIHYKDDEAERIIRQLEVLLWVLDYEREEAGRVAESIWQNSRSNRSANPRDYSS